MDGHLNFTYISINFEWNPVYNTVLDIESAMELIVKIIYFINYLLHLLFITYYLLLLISNLKCCII